MARLGLLHKWVVVFCWGDGGRHGAMVLNTFAWSQPGVQQLHRWFKLLGNCVTRHLRIYLLPSRCKNRCMPVGVVQFVHSLRRMFRAIMCLHPDGRLVAQNPLFVSVPPGFYSCTLGTVVCSQTDSIHSPVSACMHARMHAYECVSVSVTMLYSCLSLCHCPCPCLCLCACASRFACAAVPCHRICVGVCIVVCKCWWGAVSVFVPFWEVWCVPACERQFGFTCCSRGTQRIYPLPYTGFMHAHITIRLHVFGVGPNGCGHR
jgi:hypothetical protein